MHNLDLAKNGARPQNVIGKPFRQHTKKKTIKRLISIFSFFFWTFIILGQTHTKNEYIGPYDSILLYNEELDDLPDLNARIEKLKKKGFSVFFYDKEWKPTTKESAIYINSLKPVQKDTFVVKDYFVTGERQSATICVPKVSDPDWSKLYLLSSYEDVRKVGKSIYWKKYGHIDYISFWEWSNWEKGHHSTGRIDTKYFERWSKTYKIINKSDLKVQELYDQIIDLDKITQKRNQVSFEVQRKIGAVYCPQLLFVFKDSAIVVTKNNIKIIKAEDRYKGLTPALCNSVYNHGYRVYSNLGEIILQTTGSYCEDADLNSLILNQLGDGGISIEGLMNTEIFVTDSDGDGKDEIYIFSTRSCDSAIKLIRISH